LESYDNTNTDNYKANLGGFIGYNRGTITYNKDKDDEYDSTFTENFENIVSMSHLYECPVDSPAICSSDVRVENFDNHVFGAYQKSKDDYDNIHVKNFYYYNYGGEIPKDGEGKIKTKNSVLNYFLNSNLITPIDYTAQTTLNDFKDIYETMNDFNAMVSHAYWSWCVKQESLGGNEKIYTLLPVDPLDKTSSQGCLAGLE
jgi:hypothetical protein